MLLLGLLELNSAAEALLLGRSAINDYDPRLVELLFSAMPCSVALHSPLLYPVHGRTGNRYMYRKRNMSNIRSICMK